MLSRRAFLAGALAVGCGRGGGGTTPTDPGPLTFAPVLTTTDAGFFSLYDAAGQLMAGTYGTPRAYISGDGLTWREVSSGITSAGESVFDMVAFGGTVFAATESTGQVFRFNGGGWQSVFRAGGDWNNSYSIVDAGGTLVTGFNNYGRGRSNRTLVCLSHNGHTWETYPIDDINHPHFGYAGGTLYLNAVRNGGGSLVRRSLDLHTWADMATDLGGFPSRMRALGNSLYFGTEQDGTIWEVSGSSVREYGRIDNAGLIGQVFPHAGALYAVSGAGWRSRSGTATLWAVNRRGSDVVAEFPEPEGWCGTSFGGRLYVGTRAEGGHGKVYRAS